MKREVWVIISRIIRCLAYMIEGTCPVVKKKKKPLDKEDERPR